MLSSPCGVISSRKVGHQGWPLLSVSWRSHQTFILHVPHPCFVVVCPHSSWSYSASFITNRSIQRLAFNSFLSDDVVNSNCLCFCIILKSFIPALSQLNIGLFDVPLGHGKGMIFLQPPRIQHVRTTSV